MSPIILKIVYAINFALKKKKKKSLFPFSRKYCLGFSNWSWLGHFPREILVQRFSLLGFFFLLFFLTEISARIAVVSNSHSISMVQFDGAGKKIVENLANFKAKLILFCYGRLI